MVSAYRFMLEKAEAALNIVFGSALGAYLGVALSISPESINPWRLAGFLAIVYWYVKSLLALQHYPSEKYWIPFFLIGILTANLLYLSFRLSEGLPLDEHVYLAITALWLAMVFFETAQNLVAERFVPRRSK